MCNSTDCKYFDSNENGYPCDHCIRLVEDMTDDHYEKQMKLFYFTFGSGQRLQGYCQPIYATDWVQARERMIELYGVVWAFQYTEEQWNGFKNNRDRLWIMEKELNPVYA